MSVLEATITAAVCGGRGRRWGKAHGQHNALTVATKTRDPMAARPYH